MIIYILYPRISGRLKCVYQNYILTPPYLLFFLGVIKKIIIKNKNTCHEIKRTLNYHKRFKIITNKLHTQSQYFIKEITVNRLKGPS